MSDDVGIGTAFAGELDTETLMQHADAALYRAKNRGRNCFEVFAVGWDENLQENERKQGETEAV